MGGRRASCPTGNILTPCKPLRRTDGRINTSRQMSGGPSTLSNFSILKECRSRFFSQKSSGSILFYLREPAFVPDFRSHSPGTHQHDPDLVLCGNFLTQKSGPISICISDRYWNRTSNLFLVMETCCHYTNRSSTKTSKTRSTVLLISRLVNLLFSK